jgi:acyl carrier protein phosphodiesterase
LNFLGHLFFSNNDKDLMLSNLYGDFVKGKDFTNYSAIVQKGIHLHRAIDHYIDTHPAVTDLRLSLYDKLPKVAGVAIDLYFDHLLARNWENYHSKEYTLFLNEFYLHQANFEQELKKEFNEFMGYFRTRKWLNHYPTAFGLAKSCEGVAKRISFENVLHKAPEQFYKRENEIQACFEIYMKDAILKFQNQI